MKIMLFSDIHWSTSSSMITMRGERYSKRLELLIKSLNWIEDLSLKLGCEREICLGDFCDKSVLTDEEISALKEIKWNALKKYFIIGNHESGQHDLKFSTVNALDNPNIKIISKPTRIDSEKNTYYFLPYIVESDREDLKTILERIDQDLPSKQNKIIFSHNDIAGQNYAGFISKIGFSIKEIEDNCDLYLNGHLHNQQWVTKKILNVGSSSAHNFTNDSIVYKYGVWVLDTDTLKLEFYENPYSLNFYKFEILVEKDLFKLDKIKDNSCLSIKLTSDLYEKTKEYLDMKKDKILAERLTPIKSVENTNSEVSIQDLQSDHLEMLIKFCKETLENSDILNTELAEICK